MAEKLNDMVLSPELKNGEAVKEVFETDSDQNIRNKVIIAITNRRVLMRPKKGKHNGENKKDSIEVEIGDIRALREKKGLILSKISVETENAIQKLPKMNKNEAEKVIKSIIEAGGLVESGWKQEGQSKAEKGLRGSIATTLGTLGVVGSIVGALIGLMFILSGMMISLTIIGAIIGVPLIYLGMLIISGATGIGAVGVGSGILTGTSISDGQKEWIPPERKAKQDNDPKKT